MRTIAAEGGKPLMMHAEKWRARLSSAAWDPTVPIGLFQPYVKLLNVATKRGRSNIQTLGMTHHLFET